MVKPILGAWLFFSPWALGYAGDIVMMWNALIVDALTFIVAIWDLNTIPRMVQRNV